MFGQRHATLVCSLVLLWGALDLRAADRVKAGNWETKLAMASGKPVVSSYCITAADAKLMNGDLPSLRKYVEESTAHNTRGRCVVRDVKLNGNQTIVTIACGKTVVVGTTTYHGDHYESSASNGTTITGRRVGECP